MSKEEKKDRLCYDYGTIRSYRPGEPNLMPADLGLFTRSIGCRE